MRCSEPKIEDSMLLCSIITPLYYLGLHISAQNLILSESVPMVIAVHCIIFFPLMLMQRFIYIVSLNPQQSCIKNRLL